MQLVEAIKAEMNRRGLAIADERYRKYAPYPPFPKQREVLESKARFLLCGGGAGGAKSFGALIKVAELVEKFPISVWIVRRHKKDLSLAGAMKYLADGWWKGTDAKWNSAESTYHFPSGATVFFGAVDHEADLRKFQGGMAQLIIIDEAGQWVYAWIEWLYTRLRKVTGLAVDPQVILTANPGGKCHNELVKAYGIVQDGDTFIGTTGGEYQYLHFTKDDNPALDQEDYEKSLAAISDPVVRAQMRDGDWSAIRAGKYAQREMFKLITMDDVPPMLFHARGWDIGISGNGDASAGALMVRRGEDYFLLDMYHHRVDTPTVNDHILGKMRSDPKPTVHAFENQVFTMPTIQFLERHTFVERMPWNDQDNWRRLEVYASGRGDHADLREKVRFTPVPCRGSKLERASLAFQALHDGRFYVVRADWNERVINEFLQFTNDEDDVDDQIDAVGVATKALMMLPERRRERDVRPVAGSSAYWAEYQRLNGHLG